MRTTFGEFLSESIGTAKFETAIDLIVTYLTKKLGTLTKMPGMEEYVKADGEKGVGLRYFTGKKSFRFNWVKQGDLNKVNSVDVWDGSSFHPNYTIDTKDISLVRVLPNLVAQIAHPKVGEYKIVSESLLAEAPVKSTSKVYEEIVDFINEQEGAPFTGAKIAQLGNPGTKYLKVFYAFLRAAKKKSWNIEQKGNRTNYAFVGDEEEFDSDFRSKVFADIGEPDSPDAVIRVGKGQDETISSPEIEKLAKEAAKKNAIPYEEQLNDMAEIIKGVVQKNLANAIFVTGKGGTGKTHTIEKTLADMGMTDGHGYYKNTTTASPSAMFRVLFANKDGVVVFDDSDNALEDTEGRNVIKAATDSRKIRKLVWQKTAGWTFDPDKPPKDVRDGNKDETEWYEDQVESGFTPKQFYFTGKIIFISNLPVTRLDPDGALRSRAFLIVLDPSHDELIAFMRKIVDKIPLEDGLKLSPKERQEVVDVIEADRTAEDISIRKMVRGLNIRAAGMTNWKDLLKRYA